MSDTADYYKGPDLSYIETASGGKFYAGNPTFDVIDISLALAKNCRFNGHTSLFYSVAQHSLMVAAIMEIDGHDGLEGLLHDATEAYLTDVPAPLKQFLPDFKLLDGQWETKLRQKYGLPPHKSEACQRADWIALFIEAKYMMMSEGATFVDPKNLRETALTEPKYRHLHNWIIERKWYDVARDFRVTFYTYTGVRGGR